MRRKIGQGVLLAAALFASLFYAPAAGYAAPGAAQLAPSAALASFDGPYELLLLAGGSHDYCLDAEASQIHNGGKIQLYTCNHWANQQWYLDGYLLRNGANQNFCLDAEASHIQNGGSIQLFSCNGWDNQQWALVRL
jgi:hypothetical protein